MPTVREVEKALFELAPRELAQDWDNVGLLVGDPEGMVSAVLVALDVTETVAREAEELGAGLIVAHHPVMNCAWHPVQTIRGDDPQGRLLLRLIRSRTAAICMHTNLDAAAGGVNDALARALGLAEVEPLGEDGIGRVGTLPEEMALSAFLPLVRQRLRPNGIRYVSAGRSVRRVAVGGGACGEYALRALELGCDTFVTADIKYNGFLDAGELGLNLLDAGHYPTENVVCPAVVRYLARCFPGLTIHPSASHREAVQYYV